jgi:hypothetical protein
VQTLSCIVIPLHVLSSLAPAEALPFSMMSLLWRGGSAVAGNSRPQAKLLRDGWELEPFKSAPRMVVFR